ncbi:MAG: ketosteroid isomerase-related protein [Novosphingobium sp.]
MEPRTQALDLLTRYYAAFNAGDWPGMLACLDERVIHDINQGGRQIGKAAFADFLAHMGRCYRERLDGIVLMASDDGSRAAAEFTVHGQYLSTDEGLPEASGQTYVLPAGAFFSIAGGLITRVTVYYNLTDWTRQVGG